MSDSLYGERELSRRRFLAMGGTPAAAGAFGSLVDPLAALGAAPKWPKGRSAALVDASRAMLKRAGSAPGSVLRPLNPKSEGDANSSAWPGEGQYLFPAGGIPTANDITGPTYLLNWGITTTDKVDARTSRAKLRASGAK